MVRRHQNEQQQIMAKITHTRGIQGRTDVPLEWLALEIFFDACFGSGKRDLPCYPKAYGRIWARWQEKDQALCEAESLEELGKAYQKRVTCKIEFSSILPGPHEQPGPIEQLYFVYRPGMGDASLTVITSSGERLESLVSKFTQLFPLPIGCVFISYDTKELCLAEFLKALLEARLGSSVPVFVAKRDIRVGDDPTRKMIKDSLLLANVIVSICTSNSITSPWLWWETATVWARNQLVIPLFAGILPEKFGGPITVLLQGRQLFDRYELMDAIREIGRRVVPSLGMSDLTDNETRELDTLHQWHRATNSAG